MTATLAMSNENLDRTPTSGVASPRLEAKMWSEGDDGVVLTDVVDRVEGDARYEDLMSMLLDQWARMAHRHCRVREVDEGVYVADVVGIEGPWADGHTPEEARDELLGVLVDWATLKLDSGDQDIPPMEGVRLTVDG